MRSRGVAAAAAGLLVGGLVAGLGGSASAAVSTWIQNGDITIPVSSYSSTGGAATIPMQGTASRYPWTIAVPDIGQVSDVNVTLTGLTHSWPEDLDIMLVGPGGQQAILFSDAGYGARASAINLTFDDEAANALPNPTGGTYPSGTYRPANYTDSSGDDLFQPPAPPGSPSTSLSIFDGTAAEGDWQLYIRDDTQNQSGSLAGWKLTFTTDGGTFTASPYPSEVTVSGLTAVRDLNLTLTGLTHPNAADLDLLLVGPHGEQALVLSDTGGDQSVAGVDLTLDDEATTPLPDIAALTTGTWQPANHGTAPDVFPTPAPNLATGVGPALSVFDGTDPNGTWKLYLTGDHTTATAGVITDWSLEITTDQAPPTGTVSINNAATTTTSTEVSLALTATDPAPEISGVARMRFSNNGSDWSAWQAYATTASWTLTGGDGVKTVHAQFRDTAGNISTTVTDTITLSTPAPAPAPAPAPPAPAPAPAPDTVSPTWVRVSPAKKAKQVSRTKTITVVVSEDLDPATVSSRTVFIKLRGASQKIKATVSYDPGRELIRINPAKKLGAQSTYRVTVTPGVHDLAGNRFDGNTSRSGFQNLRWTFTTD